MNFIDFLFELNHQTVELSKLYGKLSNILYDNGIEVPDYVWDENLYENILDFVKGFDTNDEKVALLVLNHIRADIEAFEDGVKYLKNTLLENIEIPIVKKMKEIL